jgi:DnaJ-class molecular chaperone
MEKNRTKREMFPLTRLQNALFNVLKKDQNKLLLSEKLEERVSPNMKKVDNKKPTQCPYCNGKGYFQLLLGGSETCQSCEGSGEAN